MQIELASINRRWRLVRPLDQGAQASTFAAFDALHGRTVALKILLDPAANQTFLAREFSNLAAIEHPHLVRAYDLGQVEEGPFPVGSPFFTVDLIEGQNASERFATCPPAERPRLLCQLLAEVASALAVLHHHGFIHHDVKPAVRQRTEPPRERAATTPAARGATTEDVPAAVLGP